MKGAKNAAVDVRVEIAPDGKMSIIPVKGDDPPKMTRPPLNDLRKRSLRVRILALFRRGREGMGDFGIAFLAGGAWFGQLGR